MVTKKAMTWDLPTFNDNWPFTPTLTSSHNSGDTFDVGTHLVVHTITDTANNVVHCNMTVEVVGNQKSHSV